MSVNTAYHILYLAVLIGLFLLIGVMVIRSILGPRITDRILSVNMLGTMVISSIAILSRFLDESYLVDVALIYAMISFITVLMLATMFTPTHSKRKPFSPQPDRKGNFSEAEKESAFRHMTDIHETVSAEQTDRRETVSAKQTNRRKAVSAKQTDRRKEVRADG